MYSVFRSDQRDHSGSGERRLAVPRNASQNTAKMARAAASTYRVSGFGSAVVPLDLCVEAEALGATVDFRERERGRRSSRVWPGFCIRVWQSLTQRTRRAQSFKNKEEFR